MKKYEKTLIAVFSVLIVVVAIFFTTGELERYTGTNDHAKFTLLVDDGTGNITLHEITTTKKYLGEALIDEGVIEGEQGPYGMYIKSVYGVKASYEETGTYWAFYIGGEYARSGVDTTVVTDGTTYSLRLEK